MEMNKLTPELEEAWLPMVGKEQAGDLQAVYAAAVALTAAAKHIPVHGRLSSYTSTVISIMMHMHSQLYANHAKIK